MLIFAPRRLFYQQEENEERGIEYDRLIELPDHQPAARSAPQLILNERERHLISNKLYGEYAEDQTRYDRLIEEEVRDVTNSSNRSNREKMFKSYKGVVVHFK